MRRLKCDPSLGYAVASGTTNTNKERAYSDRVYPKLLLGYQGQSTERFMKRLKFAQWNFIITLLVSKSMDGKVENNTIYLIATVTNLLHV